MTPAMYAKLQQHLTRHYEGYNISIEKLDETLPGLWVVTFSCRPQSGKTMVRLSVFESLSNGDPRETNGIILGYRD